MNENASLLTEIWKIFVRNSIFPYFQTIHHGDASINLLRDVTMICEPSTADEGRPFSPHKSFLLPPCVPPQLWHMAVKLHVSPVSWRRANEPDYARQWR
ncbi:hypothetical protein TNCT_225941 [Trichonephila clavata]|uniref:Uncharacterized protein n=1 Tax=Trichonephila clavata TaxID=2740835 RepID=A0A8X6I017_TRICU|nr:hypothetical protein TNCT_732261 [Trichonephila clavata]GFR32954.1 hypothetical protein TNCT_225941 [Trichonephila clavata]